MFAVSEECDVRIVWDDVTCSLFKEHFELGPLLGLAGTSSLRNCCLRLQEFHSQDDGNRHLGSKEASYPRSLTNTIIVWGQSP
jgi:hypothetical protein